MAEHKDFSCPACGAEFDTREELEKHGQEEHQHAGQSGTGTGGTEGTGEPSGGTSEVE